MDVRERLSQLSPEQRALLAKRLSERGKLADQASSSLPTIQTDPDGLFEPFPLTNLQQAYLIGRTGAFEMGNVASKAYLEIECRDLDLDRFQTSWRRLIERHEMLRVVVHDDGRQQVLESVPPFEIPIADLRGRGECDQNSALEETKTQLLDEIRPTDQWPLFDVRVTRIDAARSRVHVCLDLLNFDAGSISILFKELSSLYDQPGSPLPPLELSFRDYVLSESSFEESELYKKSKDYWFQRAGTLPAAPDLPLAASPTSIDRPKFERRMANLDPATWSALKQKCTESGLTTTALLLTVYAEVLGTWSRNSAFTINIPIFNRLPIHPQVNQVIGDFSSVELLEIDRSKPASFRARAQEIHAQLLSDLDHRYVDGVQVLRELSRLNGGASSRGMPVVFTNLIDHGFTDSISQLGEVVNSINQTAQVWMDLHVDEKAGSLIIKLDTVRGLFPDGMIDDMLDAACRLLGRLADDYDHWDAPGYQLIPPAQLKSRKEINDTAAPAPSGLLHCLVMDQAAQRQDKTAIVSQHRSLTYGEFTRLSCQLGRKLRTLGVRPNQLVAVVMEKGWEQVVAAYGILQSGAAYVPVDPEFPTERIHHLLAHAEVQVALTQSWVDKNIEWPEGVERICVDNCDLSDFDSSRLEPAQTEADLAYVLYTSGSTGNPKGVMIEHRSVVNRMLDVNQRFEVTADDRVIAITALQHDLSVYDLFATFLAGGTLIIPNAEQRRDPEHWASLMAREKVTLWNSVPAYMEMLVDFLENQPVGQRVVPTSLRKVMMSGDWIPVSLPDRIRALMTDARVISLGGPTETTIWDICYPIGRVDPEWRSIPYGRPMTNAQYYVLNDLLQDCPDWVVGELYIAGIGLARGYWRDEERTALQFIKHPVTGDRLYRSGDLGRFMPDGNIEIAGRADFQVKIRGFRIELGEIEATLNQHPAVREAVVATVGDSHTDKRLAAYVIPTKGSGLDESDQVQSQIDGEEEDDEAERAGSLLSPAEKVEFKLRHLEIRQEDEGKPTVDLAKTSSADERHRAKYLSRQSFRSFREEPVPLETFGQFLTCLAQLNLEDLPFPKYRYPSAGSLYPVQVYLYVRPGRVEGVEGGTYYYHPKDHQLVLLTKDAKIKRNIHTMNNRELFDGSAFSIFLVGQLKAIAPLYGTRALSQRTGKSLLGTAVSGLQTALRAAKQDQSTADISRDFCMLEAGHIGQLLMTSAQECQLGLCPVGGVDFDQVRDQFDVEESHIYLYGLVGGQIDPAQAATFSNGEEGGSVSASQQASPAAALGEELKGFAAGKLPQYMVPSAVVLLDKFPLSPNGKVDKRKLPEPDVEATEADQDFAAPESELEEKIANVWKDVLRVESVSVNSNFFDLGGTSLQVVQIHTKLKHNLKLGVSVVDLFTHTTIRKLAEHLASSAGTPEVQEGVEARAQARLVSRSRRRGKPQLGNEKAWKDIQ